MNNSVLESSKNTFYRLFTQYGYTFPTVDVFGRIVGANDQEGFFVTQAPWYATRSGNILVYKDLNKNLYSVNKVIYYWNKTAFTNHENSYAFHSNPLEIYPSDEHAERTTGKNVRCLAK